MNLFRASPLFFSLYLGHIIVMEVLAWLMLLYFGTGWITTLILACILTTSQVRVVGLDRTGYTNHSGEGQCVLNFSYYINYQCETLMPVKNIHDIPATVVLSGHPCPPLIVAHVFSSPLWPFLGGFGSVRFAVELDLEGLFQTRWFYDFMFPSQNENRDLRLLTSINSLSSSRSQFAFYLNFILCLTLISNTFLTTLFPFIPGAGRVAATWFWTPLCLQEVFLEPHPPQVCHRTPEGKGGNGPRALWQLCRHSKLQHFHSEQMHRGEVSGHCTWRCCAEESTTIAGRERSSSASFSGTTPVYSSWGQSLLNCIKPNLHITFLPCPSPPSHWGILVFQMSHPATSHPFKMPSELLSWARSRAVQASRHPPAVGTYRGWDITSSILPNLFHLACLLMGTGSRCKLL